MRLCLLWLLLGTLLSVELTPLEAQGLASGPRARLLRDRPSMGVPTGATVPPAAAASDPGGGLTLSIKQVTVDLGSGAIQTTIPFDVPFLLKGVAPKGATEVWVKYLDVTKLKRGSCPQKQDGAEPEDGPNPLEQLPWGADSLVWHPFGRDPGQKDSFSVVVPPLDAERYYCFHFSVQSRLDDTSVTAFRELAKAEMDRFFNTLPTANLDAPSAREMRVVLTRSIRAVLGPGRLVAPGTVFDLRVPWESVKGEFLRLAVSSVLKAQQQRKTTVDGYLTNQLKAVDPLRLVARSKGTERVVAALRNDETLRGVLDKDPAALTLVGLDDGILLRWAAGQEESGPPTDVTTLKDSAAIAVFKQRYDSNYARIGRLKFLLQRLLDPKGAYAKKVSDLVAHGDLVQADLDEARSIAADDGGIDRAKDALERPGANVRLMSIETATRNRGLEAFKQAVGIVALEVANSHGSTTGDVSTFRGYYVSADAGLMWAFRFGGFAPYLGTNFYFSPVSRDAPLSQRGGFRRRFSLTVGVTVKSIKDDAVTRDDLFGSQSVLVGAGYRLRQAIRIGAGALLFKKKDTNPLKTSKSLAADPYVALSFDIDAGSLIGGIGKLFQ